MAIAPRGREATYIALAALRYFFAKICVGLVYRFVVVNRNDWNDQREEFKQLTDGLSGAELRTIALQSLRKLRRENRIFDGIVNLHAEFPTTFAGLLAARKNVQIKSPWGDAFRPLFQYEMAQPYMLPVLDFVSWLVRAGLAWPLQLAEGHTPIAIRLTSAGLRFVAQDGDHALLPGYVERIAARCQKLPGSVTSLLAQSKECIDYGLTQPAISLMGVAYEVAVEHVVDSLVRRQVLKAEVRGFSSSRRIDAIKDKVPLLFPRGGGAANAERHFAILHAYDFADQLRRRRNDASHTTPTYGFDDSTEADEFYMSAGRHLPHIWRVARSRNRP